VDACAGALFGSNQRCPHGQPLLPPRPPPPTTKRRRVVTFAEVIETPPAGALNPKSKNLNTKP
jgi:hypothetical protein